MVLKVLLIEDSEEDKDVFVRFLRKIESFSADIKWAETIESAQKKLKDQTFDIVITDMDLPDGKGIKGLKKLKNEIKKYPFIILTGTDDDSILKEASSIEIYDYLVKGELTSSLLRRSIRYAINRFLFKKDQNELNKQLRRTQRMESLGRIVGGIAHDINNKLAIIKANIEMFSKVQNLDEKPRRRVDNALKTLQKTSGLIKQLLAFGRQQEIEKKKIDICEIVSDSLKLLKKIIKSNTTVNFNPLKETAYVYVDPIQIDQVLMNLVINARDAIGDDNGEITISIKKEPERKNLYTNGGKKEDFIKISVEDTGQGIEEEIKEKIFEPFFTNKQDGTGLGLSVVDGIVEQHGGFIDITSQVGKGTQFDIFIPEYKGGK